MTPSVPRGRGRAIAASGDASRSGFERRPADRAAALPKQYWTIPDRQIETSVVLAWRPLDQADPDPARGQAV